MIVQRVTDPDKLTSDEWMIALALGAIVGLLLLMIFTSIGG